jgi:hypothetical protein
MFAACMQREYEGCAQYSKIADYKTPENTSLKKN